MVHEWQNRDPLGSKVLIVGSDQCFRVPGIDFYHVVEEGLSPMSLAVPFSLKEGPRLLIVRRATGYQRRD